MKGKVRRFAVGIMAVAFIAGIVACSIVPIIREPPASEVGDEGAAPAVDKTVTVPIPPANFDIAAGLKIKEKDGVKTLKTDHFTLTLSHGDSWDAKVNSKNSITIYNTALNKAKRGGKLVTILAYAAGDKSYDVLPDYNVIGESGGLVYIAAYPTDMQYDIGKKKDIAEYQTVYAEVCRLKAGDADNPMVFRETEGI